ncbi:MAG: hypothetical protein CL528_06155 [Aequorivita sp.]|nr:hypothetical protein [Aequorivita sp.]MBP41337.1 hypothetical protein [Aequorivita sp.]
MVIFLRRNNLVRKPRPTRHRGKHNILFSIYPNPTNGVLSINSSSTVSEITIYNNIGQLLFTFKEKNQIDISTLSKGIYFVKIKDENGQTETKKVIKK